MLVQLTTRETRLGAGTAADGSGGRFRKPSQRIRAVTARPTAIAATVSQADLGKYHVNYLPARGRQAVRRCPACTLWQQLRKSSTIFC